MYDLDNEQVQDSLFENILDNLDPLVYVTEEERTEQAIKELFNLSSI